MPSPSERPPASPAALFTERAPAHGRHAHQRRRPTGWVASGLAALLVCLSSLVLLHATWPVADLGASLMREIAAVLLGGLAVLGGSWWALRRNSAATPFPGAEGSALHPNTERAPSSQTGTANGAHAAVMNAVAEANALEQVRTLAILNATPDVIIGLDDSGTIALCNPALASVFGFSSESVVGKPISDLVPNFTGESVERLARDGMFIRSTNAHVARLETNARRHDGTEFPAEVSLARVETDHGALYALVLRDLTEQRMANEMLGLYNRALECATNAVVISDMRLPNQPVFYANPAFERITGYPLMESIGQNLRILYGSDTAQPEIAALEAAQQAGESASVVLRSYRKDGSLFFNEVSIAPVRSEDGTIPHYVGVMSDVTERERSRMALAERNARLNAVFDLSPDGFVVFDREGELVYSNAAFRVMTGWTPEVTAQMTVAEFDAAFAPMCDPAIPYRPVADRLSDTHDIAAPEVIRLVQPSHRALAQLVRHNVDGRGESILYFRDVTQETEVDRMKTEFLSTAAHELRTPMVSIFGFTELLLNRPVPDGKKRDLLETIHRQSSILINMVNELLDLARIEARAGKDLKREPLAIGPLIQQTVSAILVADDSRKVRVDMPHGDTNLVLDRDKTIQALTNVLSNAYKYSPQGGDIELSTLMGTVRGQSSLGIRVVDHGIGMTPAQQARIFERFYRADPSGNIPGTGLGMSLVKEIVELQGGNVELQSEFGKGTSVTLWFPLRAQTTTPEDPARLQSS